MSNVKKVSVFTLGLLLSLAFVSASHAEEMEKGNSFSGFLKKLFHVPVKATQNTAEVAGTAVQNTGEKVLSDTGENLAEGNVPQALVQPVVGAAETAGEAAVGTLQVVPDALSSNPDEPQAETKTA